MGYSKWINRESTQIGQILNSKDVEAWETFPTFENCSGKTCYDVKTIFFHDITVKFPWRHSRHIYGCSRIYETIYPSKQPMRFPQFYVQYDNMIYFTPLGELSLYKVKKIIRLSARTFDVTIRTTNGLETNCYRNDSHPANGPVRSYWPHRIQLSLVNNHIM